MKLACVYSVSSNTATWIKETAAVDNLRQRCYFQCFQKLRANRNTRTPRPSAFVYVSPCRYELWIARRTQTSRWIHAITSKLDCRSNSFDRYSFASVWKLSNGGLHLRASVSFWSSLLLRFTWGVRPFADRMHVSQKFKLMCPVDRSSIDGAYERRHSDTAKKPEGRCSATDLEGSYP